MSMDTGMDPQPIVLAGRHIRLEPLGPQHAVDLYAAGREASIWRYLPLPAPGSRGDMEAWIAGRAARQSPPECIHFAVIALAEQRAIGSTAYLDIDREHRTLEIGWTWYGVDYQRTAVNTECKYLLLRYAFDDLNARRVCLKTDSRNERSQRAIERIGGVREGVLRNHRIAWDGADRHSVYFSIIDSEWPGVRTALESRLAQ